MNTEQERAAFEAWYRLHHGSLDVYGRDASGEYADKQVQGAFNVWQARAALAAQPAASTEPVAWIRKNGFRFNADIEPQDDSEIPLYAAPQPAEQQPAQDVARLMEVLECARKDLSDWITSFPEAAHAHTTIVIARIDAALAAYRKQETSNDNQ